MTHLVRTLCGGNHYPIVARWLLDQPGDTKPIDRELCATVLKDTRP
jgi:hypothetical protein